MYISPSTPSSSSIKTPKLVKFLTIPVCLEFTGYFDVISVHGSGETCFKPRDIFRDSLSKVRIIASTSSPTFTKSCADLKCVDHDISDTCTNPSTPSSISIKAP